MCGRFTLRLTSREIAAACGLVAGPDLAPRFNVAPSQEVLAVRKARSGREPIRARWGFRLAGGPSASRIVVNVRSETAAEKPTFREAFRLRRCVLPTDGFYEWTRGADGRPRQAWHFRRQGGGALLFAALWNEADEEDPLATVVPLTTGPNGVMRPVHDRMPVILAPDDLERWLDPAQPGEACTDLMRPCDDNLVERVRVGSHVNSARNEGPLCLEPDPQAEFDLGA
jgi:putative SOS response-associated peptidase YedK